MVLRASQFFLFVVAELKLGQVGFDVGLSFFEGSKDTLKLFDFISDDSFSLRTGNVIVVRASYSIEK